MLAYAKPKIIMLDDDHTLIDAMEYYFAAQFQDSVIVKGFLKSDHFLLYVEEHCYLPESPSSILSTFYMHEITQEQILKTLQDLSKLSAIIILDHELRGEKITGIELSTTIREYFPASYISMLTSNIPKNEAISLHNNHNIDLFIDKRDHNPIHNLYGYLSKHVNILKKDYLIDYIDLFEKVGNLDDEEYLFHKRVLMKKHNPQCFLTLNENGDIAIMQENQDIFYYQFCSNTQQFIAYE